MEKAKIIFFSAANFLIYSVVLLFGAALHKNGLISDNDVSVIGVVVTALQIGVTIGLQNSAGIHGNSDKAYSYLFSLAIFLFLAAVVLNELTPDFLKKYYPALFSLFLGLLSGIMYHGFLVDHGVLFAQKKNFNRNIIIIFFWTAIFGITKNVSLAISIGCLICSIIIFWRSKISFNLKPNLPKTIIFGLFAASFYRNDVNFLRDAYIGNKNYYEVYYYSIALSLFSGFFGLVSSAYILKSKDSLLKINVLNNIKIINIFLFYSFVLFLVNYINNIIMDLFSAFVFASINPVISSFMHLVGKSGVVYFYGLIFSIGFLAVPSVIDYGVPTSRLFFFYVIFLSAAIIFSLKVYLKKNG